MTDPVRLREFLYVDVERARSFLAQIDRGVVDAVVRKRDASFQADLEAKIFGFGGSGGYVRGQSEQESRSFQDLTFVIFEELAEEKGVILDVPKEIVSLPENWESGSVHRVLHEGQLVRLGSDIQILDPQLFTARLDRLSDFADALISLQTSDTPKERRKEAARKATAELWQGLDPGTMRTIANVVNSLLAGSIAVRVLPCGVDHPEDSFGGVLLGRTGYIQEEREALFGRYGTLLRDWTAVLQVATIPHPSSLNAGEPDFSQINLTTADERIKRATFEQVATQLMSFLEALGLSEGPRWPSISTTPIAIYRDIPQGS